MHLYSGEHISDNSSTVLGIALIVVLAIIFAVLGFFKR